MKTPSTNSGPKVPPVAQRAQDRPLLSIQETKMLRAEGALNRRTRGPKKTYQSGPPAHSSHGERRREAYHAKLLTGRQSAAQATDQLNPDRTLPSTRSYPGL
jgi:hypothetical protein